jgi:hypothetical protein
VLFDPRASSRDAPAALELDAVSLRRGEDELGLRTDGSALAMEPEDRDLRVRARLLSYADPRRIATVSACTATTPTGWRRAPAASACFSRLEPGNYRLQVQARKPMAVVAGARFPLRVLAPWWQRPWALALWAARPLRCCASPRAPIASACAIATPKCCANSAASSATRVGGEDALPGHARHEIRTPMTGVLGMAELLQAGALQPRSASRCSDPARRRAPVAAGQRRARPRAHRGRQTELGGRAFDLHELLDEVAALLRRWRRRRLASSCSARRARRARCAAMPGACARYCSTSAPTPSSSPKAAAITLRSAGAPEGVLLEVSDTGAGMDAAQLARLFRRFEQAEGLSDAQRRSGSGLGLAICQELASAMAGEIEVRSQPGEGTCPSACACRCRRPTPFRRPRTALRQASRDGGGKAVLVVEDGRHRRGSGDRPAGVTRLRGASRAAGAGGLVGTGDAALRLAFVDLDLPGMDGFELAS